MAGLSPRHLLSVPLGGAGLEVCTAVSDLYIDAVDASSRAYVCSVNTFCPEPSPQLFQISYLKKKKL